MPSVISVKGTAIIVAKPVKACLILWARAEAERPSEAIQAAAKIASDGAEKLRAKFPQISDIVISDFKIGEKDRRSESPSNKPAREAIRLVVVKLPVEMSLIGAVLDAAMDADLKINGPMLFGHLEPPTAALFLADGDALQHMATMAAIKAAQGKAERLAAALGRTIGRLVSIPATDAFEWQSSRTMELVQIIGERFYSRSPSAVEVKANVTVEFELL